MVPLVDIKFFHKEIRDGAEEKNLDLNSVKGRIMPSCNRVSALDCIRVVSPVLANELAQKVLPQGNLRWCKGEQS